MQVLVTGSYRRREAGEGFSFMTDDAFGMSPWELFCRTAAEVGRGCAEAGHQLLLQWSWANTESQLGIKPGPAGTLMSAHPESHPFWETADYHALMGFLSVVEHYRPEKAGLKDLVIIETAGSDEQHEYLGVFPDLRRYKSLPDPYRSRNAAPSSSPEPFPCDDHNDIAPYVERGLVRIVAGHRDSKVRKRRAMLEELADRADAVVLVGGGYASMGAANRAVARGTLFAVAPFARPPFEFGSVERDAVGRVPGLVLSMLPLTASSDGNPLRLARALPRELRKLNLRTGKARGLLARWRFPEIVATDLLVAGTALLAGSDAWHAATAINLSASQSAAVLAWGAAAFTAFTVASAAAAYKTITTRSALFVWTLVIGAQADVTAYAAMGTSIGIFQAAKQKSEASEANRPAFISGVGESPRSAAPSAKIARGAVPADQRGRSEASVLGPGGR